MIFGGFNERAQSAPMSEINVTPMVDVMLVLLIIFILAAPLFSHAIKLDLPKANAPAAAIKAETISISIDVKGRIYWNDDLQSPETFEQKLVSIAGHNPQPDLQLRADRATRYEVIAYIMSKAQANGLNKIGFVTETTVTPVRPEISGAASLK